MKSSFELLWDWGRKKMNLDEQILRRVDKQMLIQLWNENVTQSNQRIQKGRFMRLFFYFPKNKFIVFILFLLLKDFFEAKTHA